MGSGSDVRSYKTILTGPKKARLSRGPYEYLTSRAGLFLSYPQPDYLAFKRGRSRKLVISIFLVNRFVEAHVKKGVNAGGSLLSAINDPHSFRRGAK